MLVEYTKVCGGQHIATVHIGSNLFLRAAYLPHRWRHYISVHDPNTGEPLDDDVTISYNIAGPLCFSVSICLYILFIASFDNQ